MTLNGTRLSLSAVFLVSFAIQAIVFLVVRGRMWEDELQALILKLLAIYSVHLGVIAGGMFGQSRMQLSQPSPAAGIVAILFAVVWNLLLVGRSLSFALARQDSVTDLIQYLQTVADSGSFLVVAALAFFFTRNEPKSARRSG